MERKLAHVEKIVAINPIDGADKIEVATVLGWQCVVRKGEYKVGDLCCYIEIDSILPAIPYFEFMQERHFRVRTIKLRKQISQGLVVPLVDLVQINSKLDIRDTAFHEGEDLTEYLGITKYLSPSEREADEQPVSKKKHSAFTKFMTRFGWYRKLTKQRSKSFPDWIKKTDEERVQNMPLVVNSDKTFYVTEKVDGQSATYWYKKQMFGGEFGICSRNIRKFEWDNSNWSRVAKLFHIKDKLKRYRKDVAIQGEIIGPSIQGNKYRVNDFKFYVFNVFDIKNKKYFNIEQIIEFCREVGLSYVPVITTCTAIRDTISAIVEHSKGSSILNNKVQREGLVWRSNDGLISFKVINPDFLLKNGE